jgi:hypothetical protein
MIVGKNVTEANEMGRCEDDEHRPIRRVASTRVQAEM